MSGSYVPVSLKESSTASLSPSSSLQDSLISTPSSESLPVAVSSKPMIEVVAPSTLPEGFEFTVELQQQQQQQPGTPQTFQVTVPPGGVEKGQTFAVPMPMFTTTRSTTTTTTTTIPVGHWRDHLYDCFRHGICHPHCWASWMCTFLATGQVIRRMQFDWTGRPTERLSARAMNFSIIAGMVVVYFVVHFVIYVSMVSMDPNLRQQEDDSSSNWSPVEAEEDEPAVFKFLVILYQFFGITYWIVSTIILIRTRRSVRERYGIPGQDLEDCLCGVCCHCCVAGQLLRHTTDYDVHPSAIFTDTGLPPHVPGIV